MYSQQKHSAIIPDHRSLQRRFSRVIDWPISDEIRRVRIERAKRELAESKRSIAEIAGWFVCRQLSC